MPEQGLPEPGTTCAIYSTVCTSFSGRGGLRLPDAPKSAGLDRCCKQCEQSGEGMKIVQQIQCSAAKLYRQYTTRTAVAQMRSQLPMTLLGGALLCLGGA